MMPLASVTAMAYSVAAACEMHAGNALQTPETGGRCERNPRPTLGLARHSLEIAQ